MHEGKRATTEDSHDSGKFVKLGKFGKFSKFDTQFDRRLVISEVDPINALEDQATVVPPLTKDNGNFGKLGKFETLLDRRLVISEVISEVDPINALEDQACCCLLRQGSKTFLILIID